MCALHTLTRSKAFAKFQVREMNAMQISGLYLHQESLPHKLAVEALQSRVLGPGEDDEADVGHLSGVGGVPR